MENVGVRLVFTDEATKVCSNLSPQMREAMRKVMLGATLLGRAAEENSTAEEAVEIMSMATRILNQTTGNADERVLNFCKILAGRYPRMNVNPTTLTLLEGMSFSNKHYEVLAASLAWVSVERDKCVDFVELTDKLLPIGPPTEAYLDELVTYYEEFPDLLWPPSLIVSEVSGTRQ